MWHCRWCGEMTLVIYSDPSTWLCPDRADALYEDIWWTVARLLELEA